ncbi:MAG TPA: DUF2924 domain-containing protein [Stellaceae bacterium]|nr:DUF2924 domain-containing protein [Stellaceae bacterium]
MTRDRTRRGSGELPASGAAIADIAAAITALEMCTTDDLRIEWRKLHRASPPSRLSRDLILRAIAHGLQERAYGGLSLATQRYLNTLADELSAKGAAYFNAAVALKPGSKLVREWHGRAHSVIVLDDGFEYEGQRHRSLTGIATLITGVHWSGPTFFGLKKPSRTPSEARR